MLKKLVISQWALVIVIIIIASFLRLYNITELPPGLYPDEAMNGNNALEALSNTNFSAEGGSAFGGKWFYPENNGREGLFINIQAISVAIFGNVPWALRSVSAIFGILTVLGIYFLVKELINYVSAPLETPPLNETPIRERLGLLTGSTEINEKLRNNIALLSSFFLATSFWHINFSRIGFRAIMAPFFIIFALYFLFRSFNKNYSLGSGILAGLFFGLGFHSYIAFRGLPILILIVFIIDWFKNPLRRDSLIKIFIWFVIISLIVFAPLGYHFIKNPQDFMGRTTQVSIFSSPTPIKDLTINILKTAGMFNFSGDYNWRHNYAGKPELFWPVGILFVIGILLGLRMFFEKVSRRLSGHGVPTLVGTSEAESQAANERLGERDRVFREEYSQVYIILFAWIAIAALPVVVSNEGIPHALRAIIMIPPIFILAGIGGIWLYEFIKSRLNRETNAKPYAKLTRKILLVVSGYTLMAILIFEAYIAYFILWGKNQNVQGAFSADYIQIGRELNSLPKEIPKYVVVEAGGANVRGLPMPTQTVMFITDTFTPEKQKEKNIFYILPEQKNKIPGNGYKIILR